QLHSKQKGSRSDSWNHCAFRSVRMSRRTKVPTTNILIGSQAPAWETISRGSASLGKMEAEPPDRRYQAGAG
ncbi:hypothetical protein QUB76_33065, partial [Microcoleus sp. D2B6]|uniref:hypothetical protein n=1 Tax=unclassified Microcoleus TaxID=2642155 RepID=UPI002FD43CD4